MIHHHRLSTVVNSSLSLLSFLHYSFFFRVSIAVWVLLCHCILTELSRMSQVSQVSQVNQGSARPLLGWPVVD
ncbi:hypothetical protein BDW42DRAFT_180123 [Aspergillus taichungensis]|uniref:Uncharacterized protein n=1 Tax=Aspergillus taichungensis TaxID=482145 RepID=A0A2J5HFU6_9EURO|nr:hypothetical protein BDW42DRAFT_180123 [Aspergillus taichungensis]